MSASSSNTGAVIAAVGLVLVAGCLVVVAILVGRRAGARARPTTTGERVRVTA
ncbi:MAG: hypothetical protein ACRD2W_02970 [Acidimicrobiales bacterium]